MRRLAVPFALSLLSFIWAVLSGCQVGPDYKKPEAHIPGEWSGREQSGIAPAAPAYGGTWGWWAKLQDPELERLIAEALAANLTLEAAEYRLRRARALIGAAEARLLPRAGASAEYTRAYLSEQLPVLDQFFQLGQVEREQELYAAAFDAGWELDLFGGNWRRVEAAEASMAQIEAGLEDARISLVAELARNYFELRRSQQQLIQLERQIEISESLRELAQTRLKTGVGSESAYTETELRWQRLKAQAPALLAEEAAAAYRIAVLTSGDARKTLARLSPAQSLPQFVDPVAVGLPGEILRHRPDIRAAERALAEATAMVGAEIAELYPKFSLTGAIGSQTTEFGELFASQTGTWLIRPTIQWNLFQGGAVRARIDAAEAGQAAALASYRQAILRVVGEVETRLTQYGRSLESYRHLAEAQVQLLRALELAEDAQDAGVVGHARVLETESAVSEGEAHLAAARAEVLVSLAALNKALGGGSESWVR